MKPALLLTLVLAALPAAAAEESAAPERWAGIEFLWAKTPAGALARQPTLGFVNDGGHDHQVCVFAMPGTATARSLAIEAADATGGLVWRTVDDGFDGTKRCFDAQLDGRGAPGRWTYRAYFDGEAEPAGSASIEVARTLEDAPFHAPSQTPYVLGRPNYDAAVSAPEDWRGRLVWLIHVDAAGAVTRVEVEVAEGVGERMRDRALAAGWLSRFPPDPSRGPEGFTYRRELKFSPD